MYLYKLSKETDPELHSRCLKPNTVIREYLSCYIILGLAIIVELLYLVGGRVRFKVIKNFKPFLLKLCEESQQ
jgi:hypothetical protein